MLETFIELQIYNQITIDGLNSITSVTFAKRLYDFGHANLCLNLLMMSMLIWKRIFFRLREQWMYTSSHTQLATDDHVRVS